MPAVKQPAKATRRSAPRLPPRFRLGEHRWSATERAAVISVLAVVMGSLFITSYSLALGDPVPHRIDAGLVGDPTAHKRTVDAVQRVAGGSLVFHRYPSVPAAVHAGRSLLVTRDLRCWRVAAELLMRRPQRTSLHWREAHLQAHCQGKRTDLPP